MILVTGGTGYIGSHTVLSLMASGHDVLILDNLSNSSARVIDRIHKIAGKKPAFIEGDVRDKSVLKKLFSQHAFKAVMHFAGVKAVGESVAKPVDYYDQNVGGTIALLKAMQAAGVKTLVFSSSATVYGDPDKMPVRETAPCAPTSPYAQTKRMVENILADLHRAEPDWRIAALRYFNPVGAHESGLIGEAPSGTPNNLMPYIAQVAGGARPELTVFGNDYATADGTGIRDYIHVSDLAGGHVAALKKLEQGGGHLTLNLGTGKGHSVLDVIKAFEKASGRPVRYQIAPRRKGDVAEYWADPSLAAETLGWRAQKTLEAMCADTWRWQEMNPQGYDK
jgi:UDP-glucose 4-epimerase